MILYPKSSSSHQCLNKNDILVGFRWNKIDARGIVRGFWSYHDVSIIIFLQKGLFALKRKFFFSFMVNKEGLFSLKRKSFILYIVISNLKILIY